MLTLFNEWNGLPDRMTTKLTQSKIHLKSWFHIVSSNGVKCKTKNLIYCCDWRTFYKIMSHDDGREQKERKRKKTYWPIVVTVRYYNLFATKSYYKRYKRFDIQKYKNCLANFQCSWLAFVFKPRQHWVVRTDVRKLSHFPCKNWICRKYKKIYGKKKPLWKRNDELKLLFIDSTKRRKAIFILLFGFIMHYAIYVCIVICLKN